MLQKVTVYAIHENINSIGGIGLIIVMISLFREYTKYQDKESQLMLFIPNETRVPDICDLIRWLR